MVYAIDTEVHLMHPDSTRPDFAEGTEEPVRRAIHEHADFSGIRELMSLDALLHSMKQNHVKHCHIMGMSWRNKSWNDANNMYIQECVIKHPNLFSGLYIPNLQDISVAVEEVKALDENVFIGVKLLPGWQGRDINDPALYPLIEIVRQRNLFLMVHTDHITQSLDGDTPQKFLDMVQNFPGLKVLAPHMAGLLCLYQNLPKYKRILRDVTYIASVSATMQFVKFAAELNPDNIILGTDFPFNHCHDQSTQIEKLQNMGLSEQVLNKILHANAERIFGYDF